MPGQFTAFIVFGIIALAVFGARFAIGDATTRIWVGIGAGAVGAFALLMLLLSSLTLVGTKDIGVVTSFGRPTGSLSNGIHVKAPWERVTSLDAAVQTDSFTQGGKDRYDCVTVRVARQATACVDVSIKWQIRQAAADSLFQNYRGFDRIRDALVTRELRQAINNQFSAYDPLAINANGDPAQASLTELAVKVQDQLRSQIGDQIDVQNVIIPVMHFDNDTQSRINALQAQVAQTRIAQQAKLTAQAQAEANQALAASVSNDPGVLQSKCLDLMQEALNKGQNIQPLAFQCLPTGTSATATIPVK